MKQQAGVVAVLCVFVVAFQNCSQKNFAVNDAEKETFLKSGSVLINTEREPSSATTEVNGTGSSNGSTTTNQTGNNGAYASVWLVCPDGIANHGGTVGLAYLKEDVKAVLIEKTKQQTERVVCEVHNVKSQILGSKRRIDLSSCPSLQSSNGFLQFLIVPESTKSNYMKARLNMTNMNPYAPAIMDMNYQIGYAEFQDPANKNNCDSEGDPLMVQLSSKPKTIELTSAHDGVMFDLLGRKNQHKPVKTAWFANNGDNDNYFVVLPDAQGSVQGIDQLFGDNTFGPDLRYSRQGFQALAKYDSNRDRTIDAKDLVFEKLRLWSDVNRDGIAQASELFTFKEKGIVILDLRFDARYKEVDQHGNKVRYKSVVVMQDESMALAHDLWLRYTTP